MQYVCGLMQRVLLNLIVFITVIQSKAMSEKNEDLNPRSVAIIMDGNRRWARSKNLSDQEGHTAGYEKLIEFLDWAIELEVRYVTIYAFSTENWKRSQKEIDHLQKLIRRLGEKDKKRLIEKEIKVTFIGEHGRFSEATRKRIKETEEATKDCKKIHLTIAFSYGGRQEIVMAAEAWARSNFKATEENFEKFLQTSHMPDPDIVIRPGKEKRLSNFLLWQVAYSELFFVDTFWPAFSKEDFLKIIDSFKQRSRRRGA